uniref:Uncharacterized protein n=1 Tax=Parascaris univalens TaxID=6257 RepID=A0A915BNA5_PARUN
MQMVFPDGGYFSDRTFLSSNLRVVLLEAKTGSIFDERFIEFYSYLRKYLENISVMHKRETLSYATQCDQQIYRSLHCLPDAFILANSLLGQLSPLTFPYWNISIF